MIAIFVVGVIPFLLGLIFELVVVSPLRVGMDQSPLYFPAQVSENTYSSINIVKSIYSSLLFFNFFIRIWNHISGLGPWRASYKNHLCDGYDGTRLVAEEGSGPGKRSKTLGHKMFYV